MSRRIFRYSAAALLLAVGPAACVDDASEPVSSGPAVEDTQVADAQTTPTTADQELKPVDFDLTALPTGTLVWEFEGYLDRETGTIQFLDMRRVQDTARHASGLRTANQAGYCEVDADNDGTAGSGDPDTVELVTDGATFYDFAPFAWADGLGCDATNNNNASPSQADFVPEGVTCADVTVRSFYGVQLNDVHVQITQFGGNGFHLAYPAATVPDGLPAGAAALGLWSYGDLEADGGANASTQTWFFRNGDDTDFLFSGVVLAEIDEICGDVPAVDDDCDGRANEGCYEYPDGADCEDDSDCLGALCDAGTCGLGCWNLSAGSDTGTAVLTGDWATASDSYSPSCGGSGSDVAVRYVAPSDGNYIFDTFGSTGDTVLEIFENDDQSCSATVSLGCNDDESAIGPSEVSGVTLTAGDEVLIVIERSSGNSGTWQLNIEAPAVCGDGVVSTGEECDDGAANSDVLADACRADCTNYTCGDGVVDSNEDCELGDANCSTLCLDLGPIPCSEGYIGSDVGYGVYSVFSTGQGNEYSPTCNVGGAPASGEEVAVGWTAPSTGDFIISTANSAASGFDTVMEIIEVTGESPAACQNGDVGGCVCTGTSLACDDDSGPGLLSEFTLSATAGSNYLFILDTNILLGASYGVGQIQLDVLPIECGDGIVVGTETCDDGGTTPGDGCDGACQVESGWDCTTAPPAASVCTETCGNSVVDTGEQCDLGADRDDDDGDGCQADCSFEPGTQFCADVDLGTFSQGDAAIVTTVDIATLGIPQAGATDCRPASRAIAYRFVAGTTGDYTISAGNGTDLVTYWRETDNMGCNDTCYDYSDSGNPESSTISATAGTEYLIFAGPYSTSATSGTFDLTLTAPPICGDGFVSGSEACDAGDTDDDDGDGCQADCTLEPGAQFCADNDLGTFSGGDAAISVNIDFADMDNDDTGNFGACYDAGLEESWRFIAGTTGTYEISATSATFDDLIVYARAATDGTCTDTCLGGDDSGNPETYALSATAGTEYVVFAGPYSSFNTTGEMDVTITAPGVCGDGVVGAGEECDLLGDTDDDDGDGCQADCTNEPGSQFCASVNLGTISAGDADYTETIDISTMGQSESTATDCRAAALDKSYYFIAGSTGVYTFNTSSSSDLEVVLRQADGTCDGTADVCNDTPESFSVNLTAGEEFVYFVGPWFTSTTTGSIDLTIIAPQLATCGDGVVEPLGGEQCDILGDTDDDDGDGCQADCTLEPGAQFCADEDLGTISAGDADIVRVIDIALMDDSESGATDCRGANVDETFRFVAGTTGPYTFNTVDVGFEDLQVNLRQATDGTCGDTAIVCNDSPESFTANLTAGTEYVYVVAPWSSSNTTGSTTLTIIPPSLSTCGDGVVESLGGEQCDILGDTDDDDGDGCQADCTFEPGAQFCADEDLGTISAGDAPIVRVVDIALMDESEGVTDCAGANVDETYRFIAGTSGDYTFETVDVGFEDLQVNLRQATDGTCGDTAIVCNDFPETFTQTLTAGTEYVYVVAPWSSSNTTGSTTVTIYPPPLCGDGLIGTGETCDLGGGDADDDDGDGCQADCNPEPGFICDGLEPSTCSAGNCWDTDLGSVATGTFTGTTSGSSADAGGCSSSNGPETYLKWTAPSDGTLELSTCSSSFDTTLYVRADDGTCGGTELDCGGDDLGPGDGCTQYTSEASVVVTSGDELIIVIDGWGSGDSGAWQLDLNLAAAPSCPEVIDCAAAGASNLSWVGDGYCDSGNNIAGCWDGGDCCASTCVDASYTCGSNGFTCNDPCAP